jgi:hypothetical protein
MSDEINPRIGKDGRKVPMKVTMRRHLEKKLVPKAKAKRDVQRALAEKKCFACSETKSIDQFKSRTIETFNGAPRVEICGLCLPCDRSSRRARNKEEWEGEEFVSPYANAYALGHSFDENLNCSASGCSITLDELQESPAKCKGRLMSRGKYSDKPRGNKKMMVKAVVRTRKF